MADTPTGETVTPEAPSNNVTPTATPAVNAVDPAEVERLKKEAEQARMRANQLENELKKRTEAEEAARLKQLEENEEWKSVAEQERAKREALEAEREAETRNRELKQATNQVFSQFPAEVIEIAEETGLGLNDTSEEAQAALKAKLEKIATKVVTEKKVTPNNPQNPTPPAAGRDQLIQNMRAGDKNARQQVISSLEAVKVMRQMAGYQE